MLNNHFTIFKAAEENKFLGTLALVENWLTQVIALTNSSQITAPAFIKNNIDSFADKAKQYFIDLHKLEEFIKEEVVNDTALAKAFLNQGRNLAKAFVEHGSLDIDPTDSFIKNN